MWSDEAHSLVRDTPGPAAPARDEAAASNDAERNQSPLPASDGDFAIRVRGISKSYFIYERPEDRLKQFIVPRLRRLIGRQPRAYYREFWALRDISFDLRRGETVGIVGRNGAGKSTLLEILCGTLRPNSGSVEVNGRVAALLELGCGFNSEFTGRENVYLYAGVIGLTRKEIDERYNDIVAFADIGDFIEQPVKTYSTGMQVRLAFAVAASVEPDILVVDEVLSVGDVRFQAKCFRRLEELISKGTSVLFVSHSVEQVTRHCDRAILIENGGIDMIGAAKDVTNRYLDLLFGFDRRRSDKSPRSMRELMPLPGGARQPNQTEGFESRLGYNPMEFRWGDGEAEIFDFLISTDGVNHETHLTTGLRVSVIMWVRFRRDVGFPIFGLTVKTPDGVTVFGCNSRDCASGPVVRPARAGETQCVSFSFNQLLCAGQYFISLGVAEGQGETDAVPLDRRFDSIHIHVTNPISRSFGLAEFNLAVGVQ